MRIKLTIISYGAILALKIASFDISFEEIVGVASLISNIANLHA